MSLVFDAVWSRVTKKPFNLEFAVTNNCDFRCRSCNQWRTQKTDELSLSEISRIFTSYDGFKVVGITGGEPFLRVDLAEIVDVIQQTQPSLNELFITTNGSMPDRINKILNQILEAPPHFTIINGGDFRPKIRVLVSIDGPEEIHNNLRQVPTAYKNARISLSLLCDLQKQFSNLTTGITFGYNPFNFKQYDLVLDEMENLASIYNLENVVCFEWWGNLYEKSEEEWANREYVKAFKQHVPRIKKLISHRKSGLTFARALFYDLSEIYEEPNKQAVPCLGGLIRYYLDAQGRVFPCVVYDACMGDLRELDYDFNKIFNSAHAQIVRGDIKNKRCLNCYLTCELIPSMMAQPLRSLWALL